jgi:hypothetical protein
VAFAALRTGTAERYALVDQHVIADLAGFADDDAGAVVDEKTPSDARARMDFDVGKKAAELRNHSRQES